MERARTKPTDSLDAYDLYLRALPEFHLFTAEGFLRAEELLRRAVGIDPNFSDAWAGLADCISRLYNVGWLTDAESVAQASCEAASRAIRADPDNGVALAAAAWCYTIFAAQHEQGLEYATRAIRLNPFSFYVRARCGWALLHCGKTRDAVESFDAALRLSPLDPERYMALGGKGAALFFEKRLDEAVDVTGRAHLLKPSHPVPLRFHAAALALAGRVSEASDAMRKLRAVHPEGRIEWVRRNPHRYPSWMLDLYTDGLRKAGLPE
jgi:adenylate cyclase